MPPTVATASYNAANQQTAFGSQTLSYDLNGNLTSDGTNTYVWNGRDQLVSMTGPGLTASFQYDAFGNRISKTVNGNTTAYLYDGPNMVQEQSGGSPSANILAGGLDEVFTRTDAGGAWSPLFDGLGNTLALADSTGTVQTQYTYDAFGQTTSSGIANGNTSQYTGRENDGTGLYYYRARYYSPTMQRFISNDPIGFSGGDVNLYAYVSNDPVNYADPSGHSLVGRVVRLVGGKILEGRRITMREAQQIRRREGNIIMDEQRLGRQAESGAFKNDRSAGDMLRHDPHQPGYSPHYQTDGKGGHTFYKGVAAFFAPNSMKLSGRSCTTSMQMFSAGLWDVAGTIDPIGMTDAIDYAFGLNDE